MSWQNVLGLVALYVIAAVFWMLSFREHRIVGSNEAVHLPKIFAVIFGKPGAGNVYNIRGIYGQLFIIEMVLSLTLYNLGWITRKWAIELLALLSFCTIITVELGRNIYRLRK